MRTSVGLMLGFAVLCSTGCSAANDHDFDSVVTGVEQRYSPACSACSLMGFISLCARATTHGGVRDLHIVQFDHIGNLDAEDLDSMMQSELGAEWQPMVKERSRRHELLSEIFVRPGEGSGRSMQMMIANYSNGELNLVGMDMNGSALAQWMHDPQAHGGPFHSGNLSHRQTD